MSKKLSELAGDVRNLISDKSGFMPDPGGLTDAVERAVNYYSQFKPRLLVWDVTGDGSAFVFDTPSDWQFQYSKIVQAQYPFDVTSHNRPSLIPPEQMEVYLHDATTEKLRFYNFTPANSKVVRIFYGVEHSITDNDSTLRSGSEEDAVAFWAAAECLRKMAAAANAIKDPDSTTLVTNFSPRAQSYIQLAEEYEKRSGLLDLPAMGVRSVNYDKRRARLTH